jgi:hypothetical protein
MLRVTLVTMLFLGLSTVSLAADTGALVESHLKQAIETRQQTQDHQDDWAADKTRLQAQFRVLEVENDELDKVVGDLNEEVTRRRDKIAAMKAEMVEIERISAELLPYLEDLLEQIDKQIDRDLPFLRTERHKRVQMLREDLKNQNSSIGLKFQRVMDTLIAEIGYGSSVGVSSKKILLEQQEVLVEVLRLGRLSLFCQTPDRQTAGYYNPAQNLWEPLPQRYNSEIQAAIEIASKHRSVEMLALPLGKVVTQ